MSHWEACDKPNGMLRSSCKSLPCRYSEAGVSISVQTGMSESLVGSLLTALSNSLPELVTTVAPVRQGALTLPVGESLVVIASMCGS